MMSIFGASFTPAYAASKGGIVQFTRSCACAWAKDHIQVNAVLPGWIDTALTVRAREQVEGLHENVLRRTPAGRWGVPDDFRGIAVFLSSVITSYSIHYTKLYEWATTSRAKRIASSSSSAR